MLPPNLSFLNPFALDDLARLGAAGDGGYVLPQSIIPRIDAMLSFGVKTNWSIEAALVERHPALVIHAYDHTVSANSLRWSLIGEALKLMLLKSRPQDVMTQARILRSYGRFWRGSRVHFRQRITNRHDFPFDATITDVFERVATASCIFVKMDIEGSEYRVIPDLLRYAARVPLLAIEFHDTEPFRPVFVEQMREIGEHYRLVHLHGNNYVGVANDGLPDVLEATFVHRSLVQTERLRDRLPIAGLDFPNDPTRAELAMIFR
jgi:hypothetical protein